MRFAFQEKGGWYEDGCSLHLDICKGCSTTSHANIWEDKHLIEDICHAAFDNEKQYDCTKRFGDVETMAECTNGADVPHPPYHWEEYDCALCGVRLTGEDNVQNWAG